MKEKKFIAIAAAVAGGVFFFIGFFTCENAPRAEATGSIISSFQIQPTPGYGTNFLITGISKKNNNFVFTDGWMLPENHFYEASTTGSIVGMCYPPLPSTGYRSTIRGLLMGLRGAKRKRAPDDNKNEGHRYRFYRFFFPRLRRLQRRRRFSFGRIRRTLIPFRLRRL
jgi:hypothetical protein